MIYPNYVVPNTVDAYSIARDKKTNTIKVLYDDKNIRDEEKTYVFNADGSASSVSHAWGIKSELPPGTFSDLMLKLSKVDELNSEIAQSMAGAFDSAKTK